MDEPSVLTFWRDGGNATTAAIMIDDELTGLVQDPDGNASGLLPIVADVTIGGVGHVNITGTTWQWAKTMTPTMMDSWVNIGTGNMYTVMDDDAGHYLRATAMYDDGYSTGKTAYIMTASVVGGDVTTPGDGVLQRYDASEDGVIQKLEYLEALDHYIAGDPDNNNERISKDTYLEVLDLYITGLGGG